MNSRFFKAVSDSESESSDGEQEAGQQRQAAGAIGAATYSFSDDEEETKRQVKSAKDKHSEQLHELIKSIKNGKKIKDFTKILPDFEELTRKYAKVKSTLDRETEGKTPRFLIKCFVELEDFVEQCWEDRERRKNMNKNNSKSLSSLRQKLRKYIKTIQDEVDSYRENPDKEDEDDDAKSDGESSEEEEKDDDDESSDDESIDSVGFVKRPADTVAQPSQPAPSQEKPKPKEDEDYGEESETDWGSSDSGSSLSSDDDKYEGNLAARFLKRLDDREDKEVKQKTKKTKPDKAREIKKKGDKDDDDDKGWESSKSHAPAAEKPKMFAKESEITHQNVLKKLIEVLAMRGKKRADKSDQAEMLIELLNITRDYKLGPAIQIRIILGLISSLLEYNTTTLEHMKVSTWDELLRQISALIEILQSNPDVTVNESIDEDEENYENSPYRLNGSPVALLERMDAEFLRLLQASDAHTPEYVDRLKYEKKVCNLIDRLQAYYESDIKKTLPAELCRVYLLKIDHMYYKFDHRVIRQRQQQEKIQLRNKLKQTGGDPEQEETVDEELITESSADVMNRLCKYIYANDTTQRATTQAILSHIYHLALHDSYFEARDLMLMSHLQGNIGKADIPLQVMYNRALVQLGLCAFRKGFIADAHAALLDIQVLGKARELLAQGLPLRHQERTAEQEKLERRRQIPFHKHINLDLLECVYLVSSMLLEIPDVAANEFSVRKKMISRLFYNQLRKSEEQPLVGLPETTREHVVAASKAMRIGNWRSCRDLIINEKVNLKVWNLFHQADSVRSMLEEKIREASLRAYLFTYSNVYDSISMEVLAKMFDLSKSTVHSIVSKMIINEELMASLDEPTQSIVMHRTEPSRLQSLALQMAEKINYMVDQNVRVSDFKQYGESGGGGGGERGGMGRGGRGNYGDREHGGGGGRGYGRRDRRDGDREHGDRRHGDRGRGDRGDREHRHRRDDRD